jgi:flagellar motor switch protein FliM
VQRAAVELVVHLAHAKLTARDLAQLEVGDVILTDTDSRRGAEVLIEDCALFQAHPGVLKGHKAIRMGTPIAKPKDAIAKQLQALGLTTATAAAK